MPVAQGRQALDDGAKGALYPWNSVALNANSSLVRTMSLQYSHLNGGKEIFLGVIHPIGLTLQGQGPKGTEHFAGIIRSNGKKHLGVSISSRAA